METLPREIINKMFLFTQHPISELFKDKFKFIIADAMECEDDNDENFYYQWLDCKEQNKYGFGQILEPEYDNEYCNFCEETQIINISRDPYHCPSCGEILSCYT